MCKNPLLMERSYARRPEQRFSVTGSAATCQHLMNKSDEALSPLTHTPRSLRRHHGDSDCRRPAELDVFHVSTGRSRQQEEAGICNANVFASCSRDFMALMFVSTSSPHLSAHRTSSSSPHRRVQLGCTDWSIHRFSLKGNKLCICFCCCADFTPSTGTDQ